MRFVLKDTLHVARLDCSRYDEGVMCKESVYFHSPDLECLIVSIKSVVGISSHDFTVALFCRPLNSNSVLLVLYLSLCVKVWF